jgi:hypothetical protein
MAGKYKNGEDATSHCLTFSAVRLLMFLHLTRTEEMLFPRR